VNLQNRERGNRATAVREREIEAGNKEKKDDEPSGLAMEMPGPPVVNNGEAERPHPRLRPQVRHNRIMITAAMDDAQQKPRQVQAFSSYK
jgi:hypothetical protein